MKLDPWFVTGLVDSEGCFSVSFTLRKKLTWGIETRPSFSVSLNQRDLMLIRKLHAFFQCGAVRYSRSDQTYKFEVRSVSDLVQKIIPHFKKYPLQGNKLEHFQRFEDICHRVHANLHKNRKHLCEIIKTAYLMNPSGKRKHEQAALLKMLDE